MQRHLRRFLSALAVAALALAATGVLALVQPNSAVTLLIYLPGIGIAEALFGLWAGVAAVLLSLCGTAYMRMCFLDDPLLAPVGYYATWPEQILLLLVGLFVVALMELRRRSGERAATSARQMAALMEYVADSIVIFDRNLRVVAVNPAARTMFGEPALGATVNALLERYRFEPTGKREPRMLEDAFATGQPLHDEGTVVDLWSQRRVEVLISAAPWRNLHNRVEGTLVLLTDVTALKQMQQRELENARHLALASMISGLTHDFNQVLDIVRRATAVLQMRAGAAESERRRYLEMIEHATQDGAALIRRLRDYAAGGTGSTSEVDLAQAAREAIELTGPLWRDRPQIQLVQTLAPVPAVRGNLSDLRRVLTNLIFNAVEALGAGGGRIEVHTGAAGGANVLAWVEDSGPGIPPELRERIFQPYVTNKPHGLGLGLFTAQKILLAHGGRLSFASTPGHGTRFTLELPAAAKNGTHAA